MYIDYSPQTGALQIELNPSKMNLTLCLALPFTPQKGGKVEKGTKVYDWEHAIYFALSLTDCQKILSYFQKGDFTQNLFLTHQNGNGNNFCSFNINGDRTYISIGPKGAMNSKPLNPEAFFILMSGCRFIVEQSPWWNDILKEMGKIVAGRSSYNPGNGPDGKPWNSNNPDNSDNQWKPNYNNRNNRGNNNYNNSYQPNMPPAPAQAPTPPGAPGVDNFSI